jgi:hypothetical protein
MGIACGLELVRSLMRELGLEPCQPRPWRHSLTAAGDLPTPEPPWYLARHAGTTKTRPQQH